MKELSIEEKAERYDKAIKKAKYYYDKGKTIEFANYIASDIFPELKKSEDEKWIPKEIAKYLKEKGGFRSCWIAWLEKQTEQKLYVNDNAKEMFIKALERVEEQNNKGYKLTDCDKNSWWEDFKAYTSYIVEQKPVWSEEDKKMCQETIDWFEKKCFPYALESENPARESIKWLKSLKDRVQRKQEWSEEDKAILEKCIGAVKVSCYSYSFKLEAENWLKHLKDRYTWKPSDEQMDALYYVTNFDYGGYKAILVSLYEQLKKLK